MIERIVEILANGHTLHGILTVPDEPRGLIIFAHGTGSSRKSPRNRLVATILNRNGFGTLLFDLLTEEENAEFENRFDINRLSRRLITVTQWIRNQRDFKNWPIGYFGASTGAAAALRAAAAFGPEVIKAVVSRGGRPDLAGAALARIQSPTLFLVGDRDPDVLALNRKALQDLNCECELKIIPGATHLFEEPGTLEVVCHQAGNWFTKYVHWKTADIDKDFIP
jgi:putative phosphoribosyl transferase